MGAASLELPPPLRLKQSASGTGRVGAEGSTAAPAERSESTPLPARSHLPPPLLSEESPLDAASVPRRLRSSTWRACVLSMERPSSSTQRSSLSMESGIGSLSMESGIGVAAEPSRRCTANALPARRRRLPRRKPAWLPQPCYRVGNVVQYLSNNVVVLHGGLLHKVCSVLVDVVEGFRQHRGQRLYRGQQRDRPSK